MHVSFELWQFHNTKSNNADQDCKTKHNIMCNNSIINRKAILNVDAYGSLLACGTGYNDTSDGFVLVCSMKGENKYSFL